MSKFASFSLHNRIFMAHSTPLISVVTVCRNCFEMLMKTARSVADQTFDNFEFIIVDGNSTDGTANLLADGTIRADIAISEPDSGIYDAMNKGVSLAKGEWIVFMNAGDTFADHSTLDRVAKVLSSTKADIVYGDALLDRGGELILKRALDPANRHRMYFHHQSAYCRRRLLVDHPFRIDVGLSGDFCFFKECMLGGAKFQHVGDPWCIYDCTGLSTNNRMSVLRSNIDIIRRFDSAADKLRFLPRLLFVVGWKSIFNHENHG